MALLHALEPDEKVRIALQAGKHHDRQANGANAFPARVLDRRYQGTQTAYGIELFGRRLEVLELGTAARHQVGSRDAGVAAARGLLGLSRHRAGVV